MCISPKKEERENSLGQGGCHTGIGLKGKQRKRRDDGGGRLKKDQKHSTGEG